MSQTHGLSMRTKLAFGVGASAEAGCYIAFNTFNFLFYNNVLGLSGTLCGLAVTLALVFDAVADPVIGYLSDRWRSKLGRRHPFMYAAPLPLAISFYCIYSPPAGLQDFSLFLWFAAFTFLFRQALSLYQVPHLALGAELSTDYHERSVVMSYNTIFQVIGGASAFFFGWTWFASVDGGAAVRTGYAPLGASVALAGAAIIFISTHFTRDQIPRLPQPRADQPRATLGAFFRQTWTCLRNRNYAMLLLGFVCLGATVGTRETLNSYLNLFYWELPATDIRYFGLASPPAYVIAFVMTARLHRWLDKRAAIIGGVSVLAFAASVPILARLAGLFPANGSPALFPCVLFFHALFYLGLATLTISVLSALADIADEHELSTGRREEGMFFAARVFFAQISSGVGHLMAGLAVDFIEFPVKARPGEVSEDTLWKLGIIDGPIAALPALLAIVFYSRFRITKQRHREIQGALALRRAGAVSPLPHAAASLRT